MNKNRLKDLVGLVAAVLGFSESCQAQVDSGSDGHDGAFNPTTNTVIDMADHPDGIYHYASVDIPSGVTVSFIPNAKNTPVVWLVQTRVVVAGVIDVAGHHAETASDCGGNGGPGGYSGGSGGSRVPEAMDPAPEFTQLLAGTRLTAPLARVNGLG